MTDPDISTKITATIKKLPTWMRHDLNVADPALRERAEESLAAMIVAAIEGDDAQGTTPRH